MSNACACGWGRETFKNQINGPHVARKAGHVCPNCRNPVHPGQQCVDWAGLWADDYGGFFSRYHAECFDLMETWGELVCGGEWTSPLDLDDASKHAIAHGDRPEWRAWLELFEQTWGHYDEQA